MRSRCFFLLTGLVVIIGPAVGLGRPSREDQISADLAARWKQLAGDAHVWRRADITDPYQQFIFDLVAYRLDAPDGEITKEQFLHMPPRKAAGDSPAKGATRPEGGRHHEPPTPGAPSHGGAPDAEAGAAAVAGAEAAFRQMDANGDGLLSPDEMEEALRAERDKWDANKDGFIDPGEFKEYFKARAATFREAARPRPPMHAGRGPRAPAPPPGPRTPDPFAPELPPNLPPWFTQYDTDGDGQIGLYEWKAAGQPIDRFLAMDFNGDGFLTPDEVLWAVGNNETPKGPKP